MRGQHEKEKDKTRPKAIFANVVISVCVVVAVFLTASVIWEYHRLGVPVPAGVLTALFGFWGGELLIVALRQIFGSDAIAKARENNNNTYGGSI